MTSRFNIGSALRDAQAQRNITNRELATRVGVSEGQVWRWRSSCDMLMSRIEEICNAMEMEVKEFLELGEVAPPKGGSDIQL